MKAIEERVEGSNASFGIGRDSREGEEEGTGALETESRCQAWMEGRSTALGLGIDPGRETGLGGTSKTQYAKFRIPISILNILIFSPFPLLLPPFCWVWNISSINLRASIGFVPEVEMPHLKANCFN